MTKVKGVALKRSKRKPAKRSTDNQQVSKRRKPALLERLKGLGEGVWNEDAQEYVNKLRR